MGLMKSANVAKMLGASRPAVGFRVGVSFDDRAVLRAVDRAERSVLMRQGAYTRRIAQRSIRRRKTSSQPGQPPHTQTGFMRRAIVYGYDRARRSVVVGAHMGQWLADLHEFGGTERLDVAVAASGRTALFRAGAKRPRWAVTVIGHKRVTYPARPFMSKALDTAKDHYPDFWKNAIRR